MKRNLLSALLLTLFAGHVSVGYTTESSVKPAPANKMLKGMYSGVETQFIDHTVRPQDDFFRNVNGKWLKQVSIPADKSNWGAFPKLRDDVQPQLRSIIEAAAAQKSDHADAESRKVGDFYASFMNEKKLEQLGIQPIAKDLAKIEALKEVREIAGLIAYFNRVGINMPFGFAVHQDNKDSTKYVADLGQAGINLPDRDYYLNQDDAKLKEVRVKYLQHIQTMLELTGQKNAKEKAAQILALETELAKVQWAQVELRDPIKAYNKFELSKLPQLAPAFAWDEYLKASGVAGKADYVIVGQPSFIQGVGKLLQEQPLAVWQAYLQWQVINGSAELLSKKIDAESFAFRGKVLSGVTEQQPRWKRGVALTNGALGESVGKVYVAKYFPPERKAQMEKLVSNLLLAYKQSIDQLDWMSAATKLEAQAKLAKFTPKIGYPNKWRNYSGLQVARDDLFGNVRRSSEFEYDFSLNKLGKAIDRDEWGMTPQTVNAYYNPELNEIVFPASMLQPPFFDAQADPAVNYGAIGAVIGHEISHGFDDEGSKYDGDGNLRNWWTEQDHKNFAAKTKMLVAQYSAFSPLPGYHVNGELSLGENIADNSGLAIAYKAYKLSLGDKPAPVINGMTGEQRFYMGFAQVWRGKMRDQRMIAMLKNGPHSPPEFRANGTLRNQPGFYEAFGVKPGDKMYLPENQRVIIW